MLFRSSQLVKLALSRSREYLADAGSVELTKNPDAMISALRKIEGRGELPGATSAVMEMCIDNPREGFGELFDTHPSVDSRIAALVKFAGGHDPGPLAIEPAEQQAQVEDQTQQQGPWGAEPQQPQQQQGPWGPEPGPAPPDRKSTRLNSSHSDRSRMPSSA